MAVNGFATLEGGEPVEVASHSRNLLEAGEYAVTVGVRTRNGSLYEPRTETVLVADHGESLLEVSVLEPPSVTAKFMERGEEARGANVTAYRDGEEAFTFRWIDRTYVEPGAYEFRVQPNQDNDLSLSATIAAGEQRELIFEMVHTVVAVIKMVASGSGIDYRENYELWQNGELARKVHWVNGVKALPGTYDLHLTNQLTPFEHSGLVIGVDDRQEFRIEVPSGQVTVAYQKADGSADRDERCWISRRAGEKWVGRKIQRAGRPIPLIPGEYQLEGWSRMGEFEMVRFEIEVGDEIQLVLRDGS
jgi:hypothetical protein